MLRKAPLLSERRDGGQVLVDPLLDSVHPLAGQEGSRLALSAALVGTGPVAMIGAHKLRGEIRRAISTPTDVSRDGAHDVSALAEHTAELSGQLLNRLPLLVQHQLALGVAKATAVDVGDCPQMRIFVIKQFSTGVEKFSVEEKSHMVEVFDRGGAGGQRTVHNFDDERCEKRPAPLPSHSSPPCRQSDSQCR